MQYYVVSHLEELNRILAWKTTVGTECEKELQAQNGG